MSRVAEAAGVGAGTIYRHFDNQNDMFVAALDAIFEQMMRPVEESHQEDALERIREIAHRHSRLMSVNGGGFAYPWMEFIAAGYHVGIRDAVADTQRRAFRVIRDIFEEGRAQGSIRQDVDTNLLTYEYLNYAWGENMTVLMGLDEFLAQELSTRMLEQILATAAVDNRRTDGAGAQHGGSGPE